MEAPGSARNRIKESPKAAASVAIRESKAPPGRIVQEQLHALLRAHLVAAPSGIALGYLGLDKLLLSPHASCRAVVRKLAEWEASPGEAGVSAVIRAAGVLVADRKVPEATRRDFVWFICMVIEDLPESGRPQGPALRTLFESARPFPSVMDGIQFPLWKRTVVAAILSGNHVVLQGLLARKPGEMDADVLDTIARALDLAQITPEFDSVVDSAGFSRCMEVVCDAIGNSESLVRALEIPPRESLPLHIRDHHCFRAYCEIVVFSKRLSSIQKGDLLANHRVLQGSTGADLASPHAALVLLCGLHSILRGDGKPVAGLAWPDACGIARRFIGQLDINWLAERLLTEDRPGAELDLAYKGAKVARTAGLPGAAKAARRLNPAPEDSKCVIS